MSDRCAVYRNRCAAGHEWESMCSVDALDFWLQERDWPCSRGSTVVKADSGYPIGIDYTNACGANVVDKQLVGEMSFDEWHASVL